MLEIKTKNTNPNFTIILPGPCQAKCSFCYWKEDKNNSNFIKGLRKALEELPPLFNQISISGGEPSLSPFFDETLNIIKEYKKSGKIQKVVLTSNGIKLINKNLDGIDHINISRHSYSDNLNSKIFETKHIPSKDDLKELANYINSFGIDVNYNVVLIDDINTNHNLIQWTNFAKETNVTSLTFRNQYGIYGISLLESYLLENNYKPNIISSCPVCRTSTFYVEGIKTKFHSSDYEPTESNKFDVNEVYEVILQSNGNLTRDWEAKKILIDLNNKENIMEMPGSNLELTKKEIKREYKDIQSKIEKNDELLSSTLENFSLKKNDLAALKLSSVTLQKNLEICLKGLETIPMDSKKGEKLVEQIKDLEKEIKKTNNSLSNAMPKEKIEIQKEVIYKETIEDNYSSCGGRMTYSSCG